MMHTYEFDLIFALPAGTEYDAYAMADAVFEAGYEDAVVGSGHKELVAVSLVEDGEEPVQLMRDTAKAILAVLPEGSSLREVRPDLVSLSEVARRLHVQRQALQKRKMPSPVRAGLYRVTEIFKCLRPANGRRKSRIDLDPAKPWFDAGDAARMINAQLDLKILDAETLETGEESHSSTMANQPA